MALLHRCAPSPPLRRHVTPPLDASPPWCIALPSQGGATAAARRPRLRRHRRRRDAPLLPTSILTQRRTQPSRRAARARPPWCTILQRQGRPEPSRRAARACRNSRLLRLSRLTCNRKSTIISPDGMRTSPFRSRIATRSDSPGRSASCAGTRSTRGSSPERTAQSSKRPTQPQYLSCISKHRI